MEHSTQYSVLYHYFSIVKREITVTVTTGATGNVNITIGSTTKTVALNSGTAKAYFSGLTSSGTITAKYLGDDKYNASSKTATLTVNKVTGYVFNVVVTNTTVGGQSRVTVTLPKDFSGSVSIGGTNVAVSNGVASRLLTAESSVGTKNVAVSISSNTKYANNSTTASYTVTKGTSTIAITGAGNTAAGTAITITLTTTGSAGAVNVTINGKSYTVSSKKVTISNGLSSGNYTVVATLAGDNNYNGAINTTSFMVSKHDTNLRVSAQNTQTIKNTKNPIKIAENIQLILTPTNNNTTKHTNTTHPIAKSKTSYSIAISNKTQNTSYNNNSINNKTFKAKSLKNQIISNTHPIANINNLNSKNSKTTNNNPIISIIAIDNSKKLIITIIPIAKIKTITNLSIAKTSIAKSINTTTKLNKLLIHYNYLDNSLIGK